MKLMASGHVGRRKVPSGPKLTPARMVREVLKTTADWEFDCVSLGFPGLVYQGKPASSPVNLGAGWQKFDYEKEFQRPVRFINDAAMQALAAYQQGRLLFLGFGTGTGAAIVVDDVLIPIEIGPFPLRRSGNFGDLLSEAGRKKLGKKEWLKLLQTGVAAVREVFKPDDTVLGGGNAKLITPVPKGCRLRDNQGAFLGAVRLWPGADMIVEAYGSSYRIKKTPGSEFPAAIPVKEVS